jgi:hypothetical protein
LLVIGLLIRSHGLLQRVNFDDALRILGDKSFHGRAFGGRICGIQGGDVGVIFCRVFDHLLASGDVGLLTRRSGLLTG